jgi:hypothetical protein
VPLNVAVPFDSGVNVTPPGKVPVKLNVDFGTVLLVVIVNVFAVPTDKGSVVNARDAGRPCDGEGEILCRRRENPIGRCECERIVSE